MVKSFSIERDVICYVRESLLLSAPEITLFLKLGIQKSKRIYYIEVVVKRESGEFEISSNLLKEAIKMLAEQTNLSSLPIKLCGEWYILTPTRFLSLIRNPLI